jgi:magnesium chelatase subunit D
MNPMQVNPVFPYAAIAGQPEFKLAIELLMVDASIGGILVLGDKGTGKTTTVRSLSQLMHAISPGFNFVNLPVGASEDRVLGSVDLEILINEKRQVLRKGLLAQAHRGILYIDEVNLLNDYLTDILLDAAASGGYHLEREGLSMWQDSRFCLIGTMNPEEGELRPQLLDRFGLCVEVRTPRDVAIRKTITQRRIDFDLDAHTMLDKWNNDQQKIQQRLLHARNLLHSIKLPEAVIEYASTISVQHNTEGLRADILLIKAARAYAAWCDDTAVTTAHVDAVVPFVLKHRSKKAPSGNTPGGNNSNSNPGGGAGKSNHASQAEKAFDSVSAGDTLKFLKKERHPARPGKAIVSMDTQRGASTDAHRKIDVFNTVKNYTATGNFSVSYIPDRSRGKLEVYFLIDSSGSMAQEDQIRYAKGVVEQTLQRHQGRQIAFAGIGLRNGEAEIFHHTTTQADQFVNALQQLKTGGKTNLTAGFEKVYQLLHRSAQSRHVQHHLYIFTDGRVNAAIDNTHDPMAEAIGYYKRYLRALSYTQVLNTEHGFVKLGNARLLAEKLQVRFSEVHR